MNVSMCLLISQSSQRLITINEMLNTNTTIRGSPVEVELDITSSLLESPGAAASIGTHRVLEKINKYLQRVDYFSLTYF